MRLIDADAVYKIFESCEIKKATIGNPLTDWEYGYTCGIERAESEIECAPTVDAEPVRHGRWIPVENDDMFCYCSECGTHEYRETIEVLRYDYCPYCGAKMNAERKEA